MGKDSKIEWTNHTFNPWWGCAKVSPACDHCYAERDAGRYQPDHVLWGVRAGRREFRDDHWNHPHVWNRSAAAASERRRVFCASMADVFDKNAPEGARDRLWQTIDDTPHLDWLLLTKRIGNAPAMLPRRWLEAQGLPHNVWLGISVCNQAEAMRDVPKLYQLKAATWFLSVEPLLGPIDFEPVFELTSETAPCCTDPGCEYCDGTGERTEGPLPHWIIVGGESGPSARPMAGAWVDRIYDFCEDHDVPFFFKQWGEWIPRARQLADQAEPHHVYPSLDISGEITDKLGKKRAGRLYRQRTHDNFPTIDGG